MIVVSLLCLLYCFHRWMVGRWHLEELGYSWSILNIAQPSFDIYTTKDQEKLCFELNDCNGLRVWQFFGFVVQVQTFNHSTLWDGF